MIFIYFPKRNIKKNKLANLPIKQSKFTENNLKVKKTY